MSELPRGWARLPLKDIAKEGGRTIDPRSFPHEEFELFSIPSFSDGAPEKVLGTAIGSAKQIVQETDVLLSKIVPHIRRVWVVPKSSGRRQIASGEWIVYRSLHLESHFIRLALSESSFRSKYLGTVSGVGGSLMRASPKQVAQFDIPLPPLAEQKRIVAKLDALNAKSARARTELARIETLVSRYKQAVLSKAFSGELTAHVREPSNETIQATISYPFTHTQSAPASWARYVFSEVCKIVGGSQPPKTTFVYAPQEGYVRLVQIRDYKSDARATYIPKQLARRFCSPTEIMIGRYGPPIFQILRGIDGAYNVALMKAEPTEAVDQEFLYWYLHHPVLFKYVEIDSKRTAGQDGVNKAHLERWPILLPPLEEQHEIVRRIESAFARIDRLAAEAKRAMELVGRLDEAILAKAFRGELVSQDENDEPAEHLLASIRAEWESAPKAKRGRGAKR